MTIVDNGQSVATILGPDTVSSPTVVDGSLTGADIQDGSIGVADLAPGAGFDPTSDQTITGEWDFTSPGQMIIAATNGVQLSSFAGDVVVTSDIVMETPGKVINVDKNAIETLLEARSTFLGDVDNRVQVSTDGLIEWGDGTAAPDTNLYRSAANILKTDDTLQVGTAIELNQPNAALFLSGSDSAIRVHELGADGTFDVVQFKKSTDSAARYAVQTDGTIKLGSGASAPDAFISRNGVGEIYLQNRIRTEFIDVQGDANSAVLVNNPGAAIPFFAGVVSGDGVSSIELREDGIVLGDGTIAHDTNLYRSAADTLKTDDNFVAAGTISALGSGVGTGLFLGPVGQINMYRNPSNRLETNSSIEVGGQLYAQGIEVSGDITMYGGGFAGGAYGSPGNTAYWVGAVGDGFSVGRFTWTREGGLSWGDGTAPHDTNLYRSAAGTLKTNSDLLVGTERIRLDAANGRIYFGNGITTDVFVYKSGSYLRTEHGLAAGAASRFDADVSVVGTMYFDLAGTVNLYKSAADTLKTDDTLQVGSAIELNQPNGALFLTGAGSAIMVHELGATDTFDVIQFKKSTDSSPRYAIQTDGMIKWGSGSATPDTNLYRDSANVLKTDDELQAAGSLTAAYGSGSQVSIGDNSGSPSVTFAGGALIQEIGGQIRLDTDTVVDSNLSVNEDVALGSAPTNLIALYGGAPVAQAAAIAAPSTPGVAYNQAEIQSIVDAVNSIRAALSGIGITA